MPDIWAPIGEFRSAALLDCAAVWILHLNSTVTGPEKKTSAVVGLTVAAFMFVLSPMKLDQ